MQSLRSKLPGKNRAELMQAVQPSVVRCTCENPGLPYLLSLGAEEEAATEARKAFLKQTAQSAIFASNHWPLRWLLRKKDLRRLRSSAGQGMTPSQSLQKQLSLLSFS